MYKYTVLEACPLPKDVYDKSRVEHYCLGWPSGKELEIKLNEIADKGWEVLHIDSNCVIFKREVR